MEYRHLGRSGLKVSEIAYGNWLTHGSQVAEDAARACVAAALDEGITTFDTADVYAGTAAEAVLGRALHGVRRESVEICTKVYWPTGPGANDRGLSRKHIMESAHASLRRLQTDYIDLYQAHRYDHATPLEETLRAFDDLVRQGKVLYVGVSEWTAGQIESALQIADDMGFDRIVSNQPEYSLLWRVIEQEGVPLCEREGVGQIVWSRSPRACSPASTTLARLRPRAPGPRRPTAAASSPSCSPTRCSSPSSASQTSSERPGTPPRRSRSPGSCPTRTCRPRSWARRAPSSSRRTCVPSRSSSPPTSSSRSTASWTRWCGVTRA